MGSMWSNEATPVNAPTSFWFQVERLYRRVPEQRRKAA